MPVLLQDGDLHFTRGLNSAMPPELLPRGSYSWAENLWFQRGILTVRPGFTWLATLPDGPLQGLYAYPNSAGMPLLVAWVAGQMWVAEHPYQRWAPVAGATCAESVEQVYGQLALQAVDRNRDGSLRLIRPRWLLVFQDGVSSPLLFDGVRVWRSTSTATTPGIPTGTHMAWAGNRLWVARGARVYASDYLDPTRFTEQVTNTLGGAQYFILPEACTGLVPAPGQSSTVRAPLIAFTTHTTTLFKSYILLREEWSETPDFQTLLFPSVGCVSARSIVAYQGTLWWYSTQGLVSLDLVQATQQSGQFLTMDLAMSRSKDYLGNGHRIAATVAKGCLLVSVPYGGERNRHTWVLDLQQSSGQTSHPVWVSVWTGVAPVQWVVFSHNGQEQVYLASQDEDGHNRIYRAFDVPGRDNGVDVPWKLETRGYTAESVDLKRIRFAEYVLSGLRGRVTWKICWSGTRWGAWKLLSQRAVHVPEGSIRPHQYSLSDVWQAWRAQSRHVRTQDAGHFVDLPWSAAGREGRPPPGETEAQDVAFRLLLCGSGPVEIVWVRLFMEALPSPTVGSPDFAEESASYGRLNGSFATEPEELDRALETEYTASATYSDMWNGIRIEGSATVRSEISLEDAQKRAQQLAEARAITYGAQYLPPKVFVLGS